jgi:hypothetical protein
VDHYRQPNDLPDVNLRYHLFYNIGFPPFWEVQVSFVLSKQSNIKFQFKLQMNIQESFGQILHETRLNK